MNSRYINLLTSVVIVTILSVSLVAFNIPPHVALMVCIVVLLIVGSLRQIKWDDLENAMTDSIQDALQVIFILALIGVLIGVWMMSGTVPTIIFYGLKVISPKYFYLNCLFICILSSSFTGSAIATVSTVGVALIGVAKGLGLPLEIAAGAIICGSCFGDKCSPLSDSTNLAACILKVDLYSHIKNLVWTTLPAILLTILIFTYLGLVQDEFDASMVDHLVSMLNENFEINLLTFLPPALVILLTLWRIPAIVTFTVGILTGLLVTFFVQKNTDFIQWASVIQDGFFLENCENELLSNLVNRGGLQSMMWAISLIGIALIFGGLLKKLEIIDTLIYTFCLRFKKRGNLTFVSAISSLLVNFITGEQYLAIILPGKVFSDLFRKNNIPLKYLSRTLEDCGTLGNPLIPWGISGAFYSTALGVSVEQYLPYAFFLYLSPLFTILFGYLKPEEYWKK